MRYRAFVLLVLCVSCASVRQIETLNQSVSKPKFSLAEKSSAEPTPSLLDFKERLLNKAFPHFTILWQNIPAEIFNSDLNFLEDKIITSHNAFGRFHRITSASILKAEDLKDKDIDVILETKIVRIDGILKLEIDYKDPILLSSYGTSLFVFKLETEANNDKKQKRLEVFQDKKALIPLFPSVGSYWSEVSSPKDSEIQEILGNTVRGTVSVFSTSPGTTIVLDGLEIGKAPLKEYSMLNGRHRFSFYKPGKDPEFQSFIIRAGKTVRIFQEWNDDISQGTILISSYPSGLDVVVGSQKKGKTQYAESGVPYGNYPVEYIRHKNSNFFQYAKTEIIVRPKSVSKISLPLSLEEGIGWEAEDFWTSSGGSPQFAASFPGSLAFQKNKDLPLPVGWYGVFSQDMIPDRISSTLKLGLSQELSGKLGFFISDKEGKSVLIVVDKTDFHIVNFGSGETEAPVTSSYRWISESPEKGRTLTWETDPEKQLLKVYLGTTLALEKPWNFKSLWQIAILTPHDSFLSGNPLRGIKIQYPDMVKFEEKLTK